MVNLEFYQVYKFK